MINFYEANKTETPSSGVNGNNNSVKYRLYLERRSLLILKDEMYTSFMHGIEEVATDYLEPHNIANLTKLGDRKLSAAVEETCGISRDRGTRVSLTIRHVPNARQLRLQFGKSLR